MLRPHLFFLVVAVSCLATPALSVGPSVVTLGTVFEVNTYTTDTQGLASVA